MTSEVLRFILAIIVAAVTSSSSAPAALQSAQPVANTVRQIEPANGCTLHQRTAGFEIATKDKSDKDAPAIDATFKTSEPVMLKSGETFRMSYQSFSELDPTFRFEAAEPFALGATNQWGEILYRSFHYESVHSRRSGEALNFQYYEVIGTWVVAQAANPITLTVSPAGAIPSETEIIDIEIEVCPAIYSGIQTNGSRPTPPQPVAHVLPNLPDIEEELVCEDHRLSASIVVSQEKGSDGKWYNVNNFVPSNKVVLKEGDWFELNYDSIPGVSPLYRMTSLDEFTVSNAHSGGVVYWNSDTYYNFDTSREYLTVGIGEIGGNFYVPNASRDINLRLHIQITDPDERRSEIAGTVRVCRMI